MARFSRARVKGVVYRALGGRCPIYKYSNRPLFKYRAFGLYNLTRPKTIAHFLRGDWLRETDIPVGCITFKRPADIPWPLSSTACSSIKCTPVNCFESDLNNGRLVENAHRLVLEALIMCFTGNSMVLKRGLPRGFSSCWSWPFPVAAVVNNFN